MQTLGLRVAVGYRNFCRLRSSSYSILTRANDTPLQPTVFLGTWTEKLKRWRSQGQDGNAENSAEKQDLKYQEKDGKSAEESETEAALKLRDEKIKEFQDKYLRALAETENVRQRLAKQVEQAKMFGIQGFAKDLLDVADILEKANSSITEKDLEIESKQFINLVEGLKLTEAELQKVFCKNGLKKIDGKGEKFDPTLHEAMFEVEGDNPGIVAVVSRYGYMLHDRTLRPARVGVVKLKG